MLVRHTPRIQDDLRRAIAHQEFVLPYQPKLEAQTRRLVGVAALLRWNIPGQGMRAPGDIVVTALTGSSTDSAYRGD